MIRVCDAIMGSGKTQSAISWMNEHHNDKFIYITPYLDETERIKKECPSLRFVSPSNKFPQYHHRKVEHTADLIHEGRNITTTHQAFKEYTVDMLEDIRRQKYTLFIDESINMLEEADFHTGDLKVLTRAGCISEDNGIYTLGNEEYDGAAFKSLFRFLKTRELIQMTTDEVTTLYYWTLTPSLITSFKNVFILTYLFKGQDLYYFLKMYNIPYKYIYVERFGKNSTGFRFSEKSGYIPEYVSSLGDMINILPGKLNNVGDDYHALSMRWFQRDDGENVSRLKNNIYNYFHNICSDTSYDEKMWTTFKEDYGRLKGKGYTNSFLAFNTRATNEYSNRTCLVYAANIFMNVSIKCFYRNAGIMVDDDIYALSTMIQWIWRSAIRNGEKVNLYMPSSRMRNILIAWINTVSKGGNRTELYKVC